MRRWSVIPQDFVGYRRMAPRVTYVVPMTPADSAAQVAIMQNQNRQALYQAGQLEHAIEDAQAKAAFASEAADAANAKVDTTIENVLQNQGIMFLLLACFIVLFIYMMR